MKKIILSIFLVSSLFCVKAQDKVSKSDSTWTKGGIVSLTFSQTSLTNWSGGGDNALSSNALLNLFANYKKGKNSWDNTLVAEYGLLQQGDNGVRKSLDKFELSTKYGRKNGGYWYYSALMEFKTQLAKGYNYGKDGAADVKVSNIFAPAYIVLSLGMDYKPNKHFSAYLSPLTGKLTIVNDKSLSDAGMYGVDKGDHLKREFGALTKFSFNKDVFENVNLKTVLDFFTAYDSSFGNIDVNWDLILNMKINEFLTATISTSLKYDDDVDYVDNGENKGPKIQFKELIGIGLSYKF